MELAVSALLRLLTLGPDHLISKFDGISDTTNPTVKVVDTNAQSSRVMPSSSKMFVGSPAFIGVRYCMLDSIRH